MRTKRVYIVGAGPGDPDLITVKARECLTTADVIVYDKLISRKLLSYRKKGCRLAYVGKEKGRPSRTQDGINHMLLRYAQTGETVIRLKGGDPFIFGRGAEEAEFLRQNGIPVEVVPGISSFYSVPELCGIPLTRRGISSGFIVVTGHEDPQKNRRAVDWKHIAGFKGTIVILMGSSNMGDIAVQLMKNGLPQNTPCAVICKGSTRQQALVVSSIGQVDGDAKHLSAPSVVVIGEVVNALYRPLAGRRFLSTSSAYLARDIVRKFKAQGALVDSVPMIRVSPITRGTMLKDIIASIDEFDWLVFTSRHAAMYFLRAYDRLGRKPRYLAGKIACVGGGTANEFARNDIVPGLIPAEFTTRALADALIRSDVKGKRIALLRTELERDVLKDLLLKAGAQIVQCNMYSVNKISNRQRLRRALARNPQGVLFCSPKSVVNFFACLKQGRKVPVGRNTVCYSIGPVTTHALRTQGVTRIVEPRKHTVDGLVEICINPRCRQGSKYDDPCN